MFNAYRILNLPFFLNVPEKCEHLTVHYVYIHELVVRSSATGSVAQLVRALHRNHKAAGSIPARGLIVAFFAADPG